MSDLQEIRLKAKERFGGICRVCRTCDGRVCVGEVPGMGGVGRGRSFINNYQALERYRLNLRVIHDVTDPVLETELFGLKLKTPIIAAAVAGAKINFAEKVSEYELALAMTGGARDAGSFGLTGDGGDPELFIDGLRAIVDVGRGIPVIKPRAEEEYIYRCIAKAEEAGATAVAIDVDAAGFINMAIRNTAVEPKNAKKIARIVESTSLPVILKGIMTVSDAQQAAEAGVAGIVVSNHGGRALDDTPGTAEVLQPIAAAVGDSITVLVDGGIRSGGDVLKCLALGADGVMIGRPLAIAAFGGGREGVRLQMEQFTNELKVAMILTGTPSVRDVTPEVITPA